MSNEFSQRLDAAASRAQAKQAQSEANADNPITEIKATVAEWKARIRPAIGRAAEEANKRTAATKITLRAEESAGHHLSTISGGTPLPRASVTAVKTAQRPRVGQMTDRQSQRLDFAVCPDGSVEMKHHDCDLTAIGPISRDQFTNDMKWLSQILDRLVP
jgi:hypothetical protein